MGVMLGVMGVMGLNEGYARKCSVGGSGGDGGDGGDDFYPRAYGGIRARARGGARTRLGNMPPITPRGWANSRIVGDLCPGFAGGDAGVMPPVMAPITPAMPPEGRDYGSRRGTPRVWRARRAWSRPRSQRSAARVGRPA